MKTNLSISLVTISLLFLTACGDSNQNQSELSSDEEKEKSESAQDCHFEYKAGSAELAWTAFKTSEKLPVGGKFTELEISGGSHSNGVSDLLKTIEFSALTNSTSTRDTTRDRKIVNFFFMKMNGTDAITGKVISADGDNDSGTCTFMLKMNDVEKEVPLNYTVLNDTLRLTGGIDVLDFDASTALSALNEACKLLHTGKDGVSKTWSTVDLSIMAALSKDCH